MKSERTWWNSEILKLGLSSWCRGESCHRSRSTRGSNNIATPSSQNAVVSRSITIIFGEWTCGHRRFFRKYFKFIQRTYMYLMRIIFEFIRGSRCGDGKILFTPWHHLTPYSLSFGALVILDFCCWCVFDCIHKINVFIWKLFPFDEKNRILLWAGTSRPIIWNKNLRSLCVSAGWMYILTLGKPRPIPVVYGICQGLPSDILSI